MVRGIPRPIETRIELPTELDEPAVLAIASATEQVVKSLLGGLLIGYEIEKVEGAFTVRIYPRSLEASPAGRERPRSHSYRRLLGGALATP